MQRQPLRLKFGYQAIRRFLRLLVVDLIFEPLVADDTVVNFVALVAHGLTAGSGRERAALSVTDDCRGPVDDVSYYQLNPVPDTGFEERRP